MHKSVPRISFNSYIRLLFLFVVIFGLSCTTLEAGVLSSSVKKSVSKNLSKSATKSANKNTAKKAAVKTEAAVAAKEALAKGLHPDLAKTFQNGKYQHRVIKKPMTVYRYHGYYNPKPDLKRNHDFAFVTKDIYLDKNKARNSLAIPKSWTDARQEYFRSITVVDTYKIKPGTVVYEGKVGKLVLNKKESYKGGGNQILVKGLMKIKPESRQRFRTFVKSQKKIQQSNADDKID